MLKKICKLLALFPFIGHSNPVTYKTEIPCGKIAYWDTKSDAHLSPPTLVFIHGHLSNKQFFTSQFNSPLLSQYRLIFLDLPGYGESDVPRDPEKVYSWPGFAESVADFIQSLGLQNVIVVGWSLGGHVGLELTSRLPQLEGLFIFGTPPIEISGEGFSRGFRIVDPKIQACFGKGDLSPEEIELLARGAGYDGSKEKKFLIDAIVQTDDRARVLYPKSILNGIGQNEVEIVRTWPNPIAVIAGADELLVNNEYIMNEVPFRNLWRSKVHLVQKAGHFVHMEQPDIVNTLIREFAKDVFSGSP